MDMKIQFAFYPLYVTYNHGIALLSALCKNYAIETELYVLDNVDSYLNNLKDNDATLIGFSCVTEEDMVKCLPFIKVAIESGKEVLLGGVYARRNQDLAIKGCRICHGDGETLPLYIINRDEDRLFRVPLYQHDLNNLPLPDYELFKNIPFDRDFVFIRNQTILPYHSSRGCVFACKFCEVSMQASGVRIRSKVEKDLTYLKEKYNPDIIYIADALPPVYSKSWRESWGNMSYPFISYIRADFKDEWLEWLINRGMVGAMFGVESGDEEYRNKELGKKLSDDAVWKTIEILNSNGVKYAAFFMEDTPNEKYHQKKETLKMMDSIQNKNGFVVKYQYKNLLGV
jgi:radical SAM superfamily enzyme YgiQ (UPF0313 family)